MATMKKRSTKKTVKKVAKKARAVDSTRLSMAAAAKALDEASQNLKEDQREIRNLLLAAGDMLNRLGSNADILTQALTAVYPRLAQGASPTKDAVHGLALDAIVKVLGAGAENLTSDDAVVLDSLSRLAGALS